MVVDKAIFTQGILALLVMMSVLITVVATGAYQDARGSRSKNTIIAFGASREGHGRDLDSPEPL